MASEIFSVTTLADSGAGSLRDAISKANAAFDADLDFAAGDHVDIQFASSLSDGVIRLETLLEIAPVTDVRIDGDIDGDGTGDITISGDTNGNGVADTGDTELLYTQYDSEAQISNLILTNGFGDSFDPTGRTTFSAVITTFGDVAFDNVVVSDSRVTGPGNDRVIYSYAGTLVNFDTLRLTDVVFEGNTTIGGDGTFSTIRGYLEGGRAASGIHNYGDITLNSATFDGAATGGTGGPDKVGGDAGVGIYNSRFGSIQAGPGLGFYGAGGEGALTGGAGGEGQADGDTFRGIFGDGATSLGLLEADFGTSGDDVVDRSAVANGRFLANQGDDEITAGLGDFVYGGAGDDLLIFSGGTGGEDGSGARGDDGDDTVIVVGDGNFAIGGGGEGNGDNGIDTLSFETGDKGVTVDLGLRTQDYVNGKTITQEQFENLIGSAFSDKLTARDDFAGATISGLAGDDTLTAGTLGGVLRGGTGKDTLIGSDAVDVMIGGSGGDDMKGGKGKDQMSGFQGKDDMVGGGGNDKMEGGGGRDDMSGGKGNDNMKGDGGRDVMNGNGGLDKMNGGAGRDDMFGGKGNDKIKGGGGRDDLSGGGGKDNLKGGGGRDILSGGKSNDTLKGGADADTFFFAKGFGRDTIADFKKGQGDQVLLAKNLFAGDLSAQEIVDTFGGKINGKAALKFGDGDNLVFKGISNIDNLVDFIDIA